MAVLNTHTTATRFDSPCPATALGVNATIVITPDGDGRAIAAVTGELDFACAHDLAAALCSALDSHALGVQLDLAEVKFFDCAALHALERARHHAERVGRPLTLKRSSAAVDLVLRLAASIRVDAAEWVAEPAR
jgi:anti-anti-sigma factor